MPKKRPVVAAGPAAVPPRAVSGRRFKMPMPWRFQPGFVRQQQANTPATAAAAARVGGCGAKIPGSAPARSVGDQEGLLPRRATRTSPVEGSDSVKLKNHTPSSARKSSQVKTGTPILIFDSSDGGNLESGARSVAGKDGQLKAGVHIVILDGPDGDDLQKGAHSGAEKDDLLKRGTRSAAAKSSPGEKAENSPRSGGAEKVDFLMKRVTRSGAEKDCQLKTGTPVVVVDSSDGGNLETGARSAAGKDCQFKTGTPVLIVDSSDGGNLETGARSGAGKDCQLKTGTHINIVILDGSDGDDSENGAPSGAGAVKDCQLKTGTPIAAAKSSPGEKMENSPRSGAEKDDCQMKRVTRSGAEKDSQLKRGTPILIVDSSDGDNLENGASGGASEDCQLDTDPHIVNLDGSDGDDLGNSARSGAEKDDQLKRGTPSAAAKSSPGEKTENIPPSGAEKDDCQLKRVTRSVNAKSSDPVNMENGARSGAEMDCQLKKHTGSATSKSSNGEKMETGTHSGAQKDCRENCVSESSKKSPVNTSGLKSNGSSADRVGEEPEGNGGGRGNGSAKESDVGAKRCMSAGPGGNGNVANCRRGRKALVPWRFQIGYKRSFSEAFDSNSVSPETTEDRAQGSSTQCTPGTRSTVRCYASPHSSVRVSAVRGFSSGKVEKETRTIINKKMRTDDNDHNQGMPETGVSLAREAAMKTLQDFRLIYKKLLDNKIDKSKEALDLQAFKIFRDRFSPQCDDKKYVGHVPGIHVGDTFHARVELCVVGLHRPHRIGIDHIKDENGTCIAVSIVAYARYSDVKDNLDAFVYAGSMTATVNQKIDGTNLALKKSMDTSTPVRVIHGFSGKGISQHKNMLIYGGLYQVEKYWREKGSEDCYVYMFRLKRMAGQKHIDIEEILKSGHTEPYDDVIVEDISEGLERIPIPVVNSVSDEYPMPYVYMSRLKYPRNYQPAPPAGCTCVGGCSASKRCGCARKNGGEIPFNHKGCIIAAKPLVYECGPSCMCPPTCPNRVGQKGIKFRLQVFKTESMGWGVKTLDFIPSGSFVCEYIGEVLDDEEAQKRNTDEYLFAIGHNYYDEALWEGLSRSIPSLQKGPGEDEDAGFAVDASKMGNFAKFINHSCTPNLYAQNVLYDHDDKSAPHIMFFACEDIPPYQELAYHYNYAIDQVYDANGNIKKKKCLCGSFECDGWLY